ncbi:MAG: HAD family hydrolase [Enterococcus sp.]
MNYKALFFDFDGTIVDTHNSNLLAYSRAIEEVLPTSQYNRELLYSEIKHGKNYRTFLPAILPQISKEEIEKISLCKSYWYKQYADKSEVNESLLSFILEVKKNYQIPIVLVTTAKEVNAREIIKFHQLESIFDQLIFGDNIARLKPFPDIYLFALAKLEVKATEVKAYEDSISGIKAAESAGILVERVKWDYQVEKLVNIT